MNRILTHLGTFLTLILAMTALSSCNVSKKIVYVQDLEDGTNLIAQLPHTVKVKPGDKISIIVKSKDPKLSELFNLSNVSYRLGYGESTFTGGQGVSVYSVSKEGTIDFPVLGTVTVAGMSREEISKLIKTKLTSANLVNDPVVTVEFHNLSFSVLGEVKNPGQYFIDRDRVSVLDALSKAGDLTIYGQRQNVLVMRQEGDEMTSYKLDLTSADSLYASPAFFLQQNDIVYVLPNDNRARQSTVNGNTFLTGSFWMSVASLLTTIVVLIRK